MYARATAWPVTTSPLNWSYRNGRPLPVQFADALSDFLGVGPAVEGANTEVAFACGSEASARGDDHRSVVQDLIENIPARRAAGRFHPDIRGIGATVDFQSASAGRFPKDFGVAHVMRHQLGDLRFASIAVHGGGGFLDRVTGAIELGSHAARPKTVKTVLVAPGVFAG